MQTQKKANCPLESLNGIGALQDKIRMAVLVGNTCYLSLVSLSELEQLIYNIYHLVDNKFQRDFG